uniref:hypothetical protein n=1 Tax=Cytobacillus oceanisediminis TaxID=665099 RepID=UPI001C9304DC
GFGFWFLVGFFEGVEMVGRDLLGVDGGWDWVIGVGEIGLMVEVGEGEVVGVVVGVVECRLG